MVPKTLAALLLLSTAHGDTSPSIEDLLSKAGNHNSMPGATQPGPMNDASPSPPASGLSSSPYGSSQNVGPSPSIHDNLLGSSPSPASSKKSGDADEDASMDILKNMVPKGNNPNNKLAALKGMMGAMSASMGTDSKGNTPKTDMFGNTPAPSTGGLMGGLFGGGRGRGGGGGGPRNPIMNDMLSAVESRMPLNKKLARVQGKGSHVHVSEQSKDIVAGIVEKFMHKERLGIGEKQCLQDNLATLTADVVGTVDDIVKGVKAMVSESHASKTPSNLAAAAARAGLSQSQELEKVKGQNQAQVVSAGLDGAMKLTSLVTLATTLMKNCVKGDALKMLNATGQHFINLQYLGRRFLVSGVDIAHRLSDGIIAYEKKDWHRFGEDIGTALRKILMSNSKRGAHLPEGVPESSIIQETAEGLMNGFFARGTGVEITDKQDPRVDIQLDLHRCIADNQEFFKEVFLGLWNMASELSADPTANGLKKMFGDLGGDDDDKSSGHGMGDMGRRAQGMGGMMGQMGQMMGSEGNSDDDDEPKWMGEFMVAAMQVPMAMSRCNIDRAEEQMMMQAMKNMKYLKVNFIFPQHIITADEATERMATAINAWTDWNFKEFGNQIGKLLEEFVLLMYPQQYEVYKQTGKLRVTSQELYAGKSLPQGVKVAGWRFTTAGVLSGIAALSMIALLATRFRRSVSQSYRDATDGEDRCTNDMEVGDTLIEVE
jgi:hypothetical protein